MKTRITLLVLIAATFVAAKWPHNPLSATFHVVKYTDAWMLNVNVSQHGAHEALKKAYPKKEISTLSDEEYKELMVAYVKSHIKISTKDDQEVSIGAGGIRLGDHQTDLRFVLEGVSLNVKSAKVSISCFSENSNHINVLKWFNGEEAKKAILNNANNYSTSFQWN